MKQHKASELIMRAALEMIVHVFLSSYNETPDAGKHRASRVFEFVYQTKHSTQNMPDLL